MSAKPIVYRFPSDFLFYPMMVSGVSDIGKSYADIHIFALVSSNMNFPTSILRGSGSLAYYFGFSGTAVKSVDATQEELNEVSPDVAAMFPKGAKISQLRDSRYIKEYTQDVMLFASSMWDENLREGTSGEKVKMLQSMLINEGVWESDFEPTGYFGAITKRAVIKFQEKYINDILKPLGLTKGTGFFGPMSRGLMKKVSFTIDSSVASANESKPVVLDYTTTNIAAYPRFTILDINTQYPHSAPLSIKPNNKFISFQQENISCVQDVDCVGIFYDTSPLSHCGGVMSPINKSGADVVRGKV